MKAKELMIGDWILYGEKPRQVRYINDRVWWDKSCHNNEIGFTHHEDEWIAAHNAKPIPLTPEILKKNDWYWGLTSNEEDIVSCVGCAYDEHWVYDEGTGEISLFFPKDTNGGELRIDDQRFNRHLEFIWNDTLYVHELQRALRLCGLNELGDNFKV